MSGTPKYTLVNAYDEIVKERVRELISQNDMCQCEKCFLDVCAMVLNDPKRNYVFFVTTPRGELFARAPELNPINSADLTVSCISAIEKVKNNPNH